MDKPLLAYTLWLSYTDSQKQKLVKLFSIPRTGESVVHVGGMTEAGNIGGIRKQDGHTPNDLYAIAVERIYGLLNQELPEKAEDQNFYGAFQSLMDNLDAIYYEQYPDEAPTVVVDEASPVPERVYDAPVEQKTEEEFVPRDPEELLKNSPAVEEPVPPPTEALISDSEVTTPKKETDAKPTKAKGAKAK